ncbi:piggyBac transposable element-derived protein 4-like [Bactrocera tryoni]|uniref:piggyBac transposable element-derived protein 4-like n=1 Tax=Bactrocera tryoni TaxID=59916 RepID=UPI001A9961CA|nr:piggyBac transposable element-derived protein 4-like [Bactrocera tryoni]
MHGLFLANLTIPFVPGEVYLGAQPNEQRSLGIARNLVMRLSNQYLDRGANITMDNFFTICFSKPMQLVSFTTHSKKNVLVLSTAHASEDVNPITKKPQVIHDYNEHKGGVDTFDKMLRGFSGKRKTNHWPMGLFYNMLDIAGLAAFRLFDVSHPMWNTNKSEKRKIFLKELSMELAQKQLQNRYKTKINSTTKIALDLINFKRFPALVSSRPSIKVNTLKRRCETCKTNKIDNKTTVVCDHCLIPTCTKHYIRTCEKCYFAKYNAEAETDSGNDEYVDNIPKTSTPNQNISERQRRISPI